MELLLKNTQTLIGSVICTIYFIITRTKPKYQLGLLIAFYIFLSKEAAAIYDPLSVPNNKFGIHIIQATPDESSPAAQLVNSSGGDWGYITVLIESKDRNVNKWQNFFNDLRKRHLIPIVRLATQPEDSYWKRPYEGEDVAWADFLDNLIWPIKNRYIIIYNEPNHGKEWGNFVDPENYAKTLDKTITALKNKNEDFFVLNGGFDASTPNQPPRYMDQHIFMEAMEQAVPGIFSKLDGWISHSYPNPGFVGPTDGFGRGSVKTFAWELQVLKDLGVNKNLPVFITETGWKHAEGIIYDKSLPTAEDAAGYFKSAFENAWSDSRIVAVTPFLLSYQQPPFDHFSFKKYNNPGFYPVFEVIANLAKTAGRPIQQNLSKLIQGEVYKSIVAGENYKINLTYKNTGQSIWGEYQPIKLTVLQGAKELGLKDVVIPQDQKIEPGDEYTFSLNLHAPQSGQYKIVLNLFSGNSPFELEPVEFVTEVKSPVILKVQSSLKWKEDHSGEYTLRIGGVIGEDIERVNLNSQGRSSKMEARFLLPGYTFKFTLEKPFYKDKTVEQQVNSGVNNLDFGELQPDIIKAIFNPSQFWKLLPFSN